jgi:hypothetical protein
MKSGVVYLMRFEIEGFYRYKIGSTNNTSRRIKETKTYIPNIELVHTFKSDDITYVETSVQKDFIKYLYEGEWYIFPENLDIICEFIKRCESAHQISTILRESGNPHFSKLRGTTNSEDYYL